MGTIHYYIKFYVLLVDQSYHLERNSSLLAFTNGLL